MALALLHNKPEQVTFSRENLDDFLEQKPELRNIHLVFTLESIHILTKRNCYSGISRLATEQVMYDAEDKQNPVLWQLLGNANRKFGMIREADNSFAESARIWKEQEGDRSPKSVAAQLQRAYLYYQIGEPQLAAN